MIFLTRSNRDTSIKNSFIVKGTWENSSNLTEPLEIQIDLSKRLSIRWNLGGHLIIVDEDILLDNLLLEKEFDLRRVNYGCQENRNSQNFLWLTPKFFVPIKTIMGGYSDLGGKYRIQDIYDMSISKKHCKTSFGIKELGLSSPIFYSENIVNIFENYVFEGRSFVPVDIH